MTQVALPSADAQPASPVMVPLRLIIEGRGACWTRRLPRLRSEEVLHSRCGGRMSRRNETKDSATWHVRARPQSSVMRFDNRPADRQPKPQTARFRGVESLEHALKIRRCEAWTRISHL